MQKCPGLVIDAKGAPLTGVSVQVNVAGGGAASIFSDNGVTSKSNPFANAANGSFEFYAADGRYDVLFTKAGMTIPSLLDYALSDPATGDVLILDRDVTLSDVVNTTNATEVYSYSLPGGTLASSRAVRLTALLDLLNNTGQAQSFPQLNVQYGGVNIIVHPGGGTVNASATRYGVTFEVLLCGANSTTAQYAAGSITLPSVAGVSGSLVTPSFATAIHNSLAVNSAVAQALRLVVTNPVASTAYSVRCLAVHVERV